MCRHFVKKKMCPWCVASVGLRVDTFSFLGDFSLNLFHYELHLNVTYPVHKFGIILLTLTIECFVNRVLPLGGLLYL